VLDGLRRSFEIEGEYLQLVDEFEASIRLSPENAWVYYNRAQICELADDRENAIADYQKALSKKNPALTPKRKAHAQARIRELSNYYWLSMCFERCVRRSLEPGDRVRDSRAKSRRTCQAVANEPYVLLARAAAERVGSSSRAAHISAR
jgi:tetratricopeptide (TPR) repeat protein